MRSKKAQLSTIMTLIDLLLIIIVFYICAGFIDTATESMHLEKTFLAKDIGLMTDTIISVPGNIELKYPENTFWFDYEIGNNEVKVSENGKKLVSSGFIGVDALKLQTARLSPDEDYKPSNSLWEKTTEIANPFFTKKHKINKNQSIDIFFIKDSNGFRIDDKGNITDDVSCVKNFGSFDIREKIVLIEDKADYTNMAAYLYDNLGAREILYNHYGHPLDKGNFKSDVDLFADKQKADLIIVIEKGDADGIKGSNAIAGYISCMVKLGDSKEADEDIVIVSLTDNIILAKDIVNVIQGASKND